MNDGHKYIVRSIAVYYAQVVAFIFASYGLIFVLYGKTKLSFWEWAAILLVAFTVGYVPNIVRQIKGAGKIKGDGG